MRHTRLLLVAAALLSAGAIEARAQAQGGVASGGVGGLAVPGFQPLDPNAKVPTGTSVISGRVTAAASGSPLRQAQLMLMALDQPQPIRRSTTSDAEGRYRFAELPAGRYILVVNKGGYVSLQYGQRRPLDGGTPIVVGDAQTLTAINVALQRGSVIAGRVTDEFGEPIARATVQAMRFNYGVDGQRQPQGMEMATTDDLGQFRLFGLAPGEYIVSASNRMGQIMGGPGSVDTSETYLTSYFPGTPNINDAQAVPLGTGQETDVQFSLSIGRLSRVAGTVVDSAGRPVANAITTLLSPSGGFNGNAGGGLTTADGAFSMSNIPPGEYILNARPMNRPGADAPLAESGDLAITVGGADLLNLRVTTSAGATVTGRVVFEGASRRDNGQGGPVRVMPQTAGPSFPLVASFGGDTGLVSDDGSFELKGVRGQVLFRVAAGQAWTLKSVRHEGVDITDTATDMNGPDGLQGLTIVLTDKVTDVSGQVVDSSGRPVKDYLVVVQPVEPKSSAALTRYLRTLRPDSDGRYRARGLPPGEYFATAIDGLEQGRQFVPDVQARLRDTARRFTVREGDTVALDLRLTPGFE
jgi:protocatechuate 3,4-dioxygenase beta subunit